MAIQESSVDSVLQKIGPLIAAFLEQQQKGSSQQPFKLLLSGLQGSGKSTWATALALALQRNKNYKVVVVSLDDFYHNHENLVRIRTENSSNKMLQTRGQPGTHDEILAQEFFASLGFGGDIKVPFFDKSQFNGEGDRAPVADWTVIKTDDRPVDVLIFEGWSIGFQSLSDDELKKKLASSASDYSSGQETSRRSTKVLHNHPLEHVVTINSNLARYNDTFISNFNYLIHLDTNDLANIYNWRIGQEHALKAAKGTGMSDDAVIEFIRGYMPAYELYLETLQNEPFIPHGAGTKTQLRIELDVNRKVVAIDEL